METEYNSLSLFDGTYITLVDPDQQERPRHVLVSDAYRAYRDGEHIHMLDSFGTPIEFNFLTHDPEDKRPVNVLTSMVGGHMPLPADTRIISRGTASTQFSFYRVSTLTDIDFHHEQLLLGVQLPSKKTFIEDNEWFLDNLDTNGKNYVITVESAEDTFNRMRQLSLAGVPSRRHSNGKDILVGELQPICFLMKLLTGQLSDMSDYEKFEKAFIDLSAKRIIRPVLPSTEAVRHLIRNTGIIFEGVLEGNFVPLLRLQSTEEVEPVYTLVAETQVRPAIETTWFTI